MKTFFFAVVLLFPSLSAFSQGQMPRSRKELPPVKLFWKYPGYVVTLARDTIYGYLELKNLVNNEDVVLFYKNEQDEKFTKKYRPKELLAYKVGPRYYESLKFKPPASYAVNDARTYHFVLKAIDGPLTLYKWYYESKARTEQRVQINKKDPWLSHVDLSFSENDLAENDYLKTPKGDWIDLNTLGMMMHFKKNMSKLVAEDKALAQKIKNKEKGYQYIDIDHIITEYNRWYLAHHPGFSK